MGLRLASWRLVGPLASTPKKLPMQSVTVHGVEDPNLLIFYQHFSKLLAGVWVHRPTQQSTMSRIPRMRRLASLQLAVAPPSPSARAPFAVCRAISNTTVTRSKNTEWVRGKLWKGEAPGPEDPYTQRPEPEDPSNLPEEALEFQSRTDKTPAAVIESRLALPPKRTEAASEKELKSADPTYIPATEAEGLEEIGNLSTWWEQEGHWGDESAFKGFGSAEKVVDKDVVEVYLRQAVVEALSLRETGVFSEWATKKWREGPRSELDQVLATEVQVQGSQASLKGDVAAIAQNLAAEADEAESIDKITPEEAREMVKSWDASWKELVLDDQLKFAVCIHPRKNSFYIQQVFSNAPCSSENVSISLRAPSSQTPNSAPPKPSSTF